MSSSARGRNGILPVNAAVLKKGTPPPSNPRPPPRNLPRLRLIVRRLPPGLTEAEFWSCIGAEWKPGAGKVDWAAFKEGKISKDPSKPSRPARAYLRVKEQSYLDTLYSNLKQTNFQDAKNTARDVCLLGPPSLEFAPLNKTPGGRVRHDGRQGTIDQDQEFIDFLQSLTEPITKPTVGGAEGTDSKSNAVTTTPLIQYIKEKKAAKAKEAALAKSSKGRPDTKDAKVGKGDMKAAVVVKNATPTAAEKARLAKATQDTVKAINKSVAAMQGKPGAQKPDPKPVATTDASKPIAPAKRERERGSASVANRILQRDLGLAPKESKRDRMLKTPGPLVEADKTPKVSLPPVNISSTPAQPQAQSGPPTGPRNSRATSIASAVSTKPAAPAVQRPAKHLPQPSNGAKSAFLKHANPSQGITEELLRAAFEAFGTLTKCEIDKKKGFGYVDFSETEGLKKAMQASPVKVGNGQVVILENKSRPQSKPGLPLTPTTSAPAPSPKVVSSLAPAKTIAAATPPPIDAAETTASTAAPNAPKGAPRSAANTTRGTRGGTFGSGRGNFGPGTRGAPRGSPRGGRGGQVQRGRGAASAVSPAPASEVPASSSTTQGA